MSSTVCAEGFYGMFSPPLNFPPLCFSLKLCFSGPNILAIQRWGALRKGPPFHWSRSYRQIERERERKRERTEKNKFRAQVVKWAVTKLQGDKHAPF